MKLSALKPPKTLLLPLMVLLSGWGLTGLATYYLSEGVALRRQREFDQAVRDALDDVKVRMQSCVTLLRGGSGLFSALREVSRHQFRDYVERLDIPRFYPGIQGIGFSRRLTRHQIPVVTQMMRTNGFPDFRVWPEDDPRSEYHSIIYLEPLDRRNRAAIGYDMFTDPIRREAMQRACDAGNAVASGKVRLVQEIEGEPQPGFLIYVPVYSTGGVPETVEERRARLIGFVYSPFRAGDFFQSLFRSENEPSVDLEIYDGTSVDPARLLFRYTSSDGSKPRFSLKQLEFEAPMEVAGTSWTLLFRSRAGPWLSGDMGLLIFFAGTGTLVSLALFYFTYSEAKARLAAERSSAELKRSQDEIQKLNRELEARVQERTAALREIHEQMEIFIYSVAHDLRAPLRAMHGFSKALLEDYGGKLDSDAVGYLRRILGAATKMDALIQDLLAYSRISRAEWPFEKVDLKRVVDVVLQGLSSEIEARKGTVRVEGELPAVWGHTPTLEQVLTNLVSNALKFVKPGTAPQVRIYAEDRNRAVRLYVEDNGIGIAPEHQERIFRVFERLHPMDTYPGTGIGLSIVRKGVERMGGRTGVESTLGVGSRFWIELPKP